MVFNRPVLVFIAACALGSITGTSALAMDLTIGPPSTDNRKNSSISSPVAGKKQRTANSEKDQRAGTERSPAKKGNNKKDRVVRAEKAKRLEKNQRNKIATYSLLDDPLLKPGRDGIGKLKLGTANSAKGLGTGLNPIAAGSPTLRQTQSVLNPTTGAPYNADAANSAGTAFDCRAKSSNTNTNVNRRELSACYVHKVDKSWRTHTYLLRGLSDGSSDWGGGLAVGYDY